MSMTAPNTRGPALEARLRGTAAGRKAIRIHTAITRNVERWYADDYDHPTFTARQGRLWRIAEMAGCAAQVTDLIRAWVESTHHLDGGGPELIARVTPQPPPAIRHDPGTGAPEITRYGERIVGPEAW